MEKEELQLKDIQSYPIGGNNPLKMVAVKVQHKTLTFPVLGLSDDCIFTLIDGRTEWMNIKQCEFKPLLRTISDLYKPCLEGGNIPIVELFKLLCTEDDPFESFKTRLMIDYLEVNDDAMFYYQEGSFRYVVEDKIEGFIPNQQELFDKMDEWMIDRRNLIGRNLAIDINTIK